MLRRSLSIFVIMVVLLSVIPVQQGVAKDDEMFKKEQHRTWETIEGLPYNAFDTISDNMGDSSEPVIAVDQDGCPHIAWQDNSYSDEDKYEIMYLRWDSMNWVTASGEVWDSEIGNANVSQNDRDSLDPELKIDSLGRAHLLWVDYSYGHEVKDTYGFSDKYGGLYHVYLDKNRWFCASGMEWQSDIGNGNLLRDAINIYQRCYRLQIDSKNNPHVAWYVRYSSRPFVEDLLYLRWNGSQWVTVDGKTPVGNASNSNISKTKNYVSFLDFILDENDYPHVVWEDGSFSYINNCRYDDDDCIRYKEELVYIHFNGEIWLTAKGEEWNPKEGNGLFCYTPVSDSCPDICWDNDGNINIIWLTPSNRTDTDDGLCFLELVDGEWLDIDGNIYDPKNGPPKLHENDELFPRMEIDSNGVIHLVTQDAGSFYARIKDGEWETIDGREFDFEIRNGVIPGQDWGLSGTDFAIDQNGKPHFVTCVNNEILYLAYNDKYWTDATGVEWNPSCGNGNISQDKCRNSSVDIEIDSKGYLHMIFKIKDVMFLQYANENNPDIIYIRWDGNQWVNASGEPWDRENDNANITNNLSYSSWGDLELDSEDNPHIAWQEHHSVKGDKSKYFDDVFYIYWDGTRWLNSSGEEWNSVEHNANATNTKGDILNHILELDSDDNPHLIWTDRTWHDDGGTYSMPMHLKCVDGVWLTIDDQKWDNVSGNARINSSLYVTGFDFKLDSNNLPNLVWIAGSDYRSSGKTHYLKYDGTDWVCLDGDKLEFEEDMPNSVILDIYNGTPKIQLDINDNPHLVMSSDSNDINYISYAKWNGSEWLTIDGFPFSLNRQNAMLIESRWDGCKYPEFQFDSQGNPHIIWQGRWGGDEYYAHWNGDAWITAEGENWDGINNANGNVSMNRYQSWYPSFALDTDDNPYIAWCDYSYGDTEILMVRNMNCRESISGKKPIEIREISNRGVIEFRPRDVVSVVNGNKLKFGFRNSMCPDEEYIFELAGIDCPTNECSKEAIRFTGQFLGITDYDSVNITAEGEEYLYYLKGMRNRDGEYNPNKGFIQRIKVDEKSETYLDFKSGTLSPELLKNGYAYPSLKELTSDFPLSDFDKALEYTSTTTELFKDGNEYCVWAEDRLSENFGLKVLNEYPDNTIQIDAGGFFNPSGFTVSDEDGHSIKLTDLNDNEKVKYENITFLIHTSSSSLNSEPEWIKIPDQKNVFEITIESEPWFEKARKANLGIESLFLKNQDGKICSWVLHTSEGDLSHDKINKYIESISKQIIVSYRGDVNRALAPTADFIFQKEYLPETEIYHVIDPDFEFNTWAPGVPYFEGELDELWTLDIGFDDFEVKYHIDSWVVESDETTFINPENGEEVDSEYKQGFIDRYSDDKYVICENENDNGNHIWTFEDGGGNVFWELIMPSNDYTEPVIFEQFMFLLVEGMGLYKVDLRDGKVLWRLKNVSIENVSYNSGTLCEYVLIWLCCSDETGKDNRLYRLDTSTDQINYLVTVEDISFVQSTFDFLHVYSKDQKNVHGLDAYHGSQYYEINIDTLFRGARFNVNSQSDMLHSFTLDDRQYIVKVTGDEDNFEFDKYEVKGKAGVVPMYMLSLQLHAGFDWMNCYYEQTDTEIHGLLPHRCIKSWIIDTTRFAETPELVIVERRGILIKVGSKLICYGEK